MADNSEVLKSFLVSLGFKIEEISQKKFDASLVGATKGALAVGAALIGAAVAVEKFVESMAEGLEKLFYISQRTGASVANIKALEGSFQSVGLAAGKGTEAVEALGDALRNPGMRAFLSNMGLDVAKDKAALVLDVLDRLKGLADNNGFKVAAQQAQEILHLSERDFAQALANLPAMHAAERERADLIAQSGLNMDKLAESSKTFGNSLRTMTAELGVISDQLLGVLIGPVTLATQNINELLKKTIEYLGLSNPENKSAFDVMIEANSYDPNAPAQGPQRPQQVDRAKLLANLEAQYGLPSGTLGSIQQIESGGNDKAQSRAGAQGPFQLLPQTAAEYGLKSGESFDFAKAAPAAARKLRGLLDRYGNDLLKAVAAYNLGEGNLDKEIGQYGNDWYNHLNPETKAYIPKFIAQMQRARLGASEGAAYVPVGQSPGASQVLHVTNAPTINVSSTGNPDETARAVAAELQRQNSDALRNAKSVFAPIN